MPKERLTIIFGGKSGEHEVSVNSARSVFEAALASGFTVDGIGITRQGEWVYLGDCSEFFDKGYRELSSDMGPSCAILPDPSQKGIWVFQGDNVVSRVDIGVVFPVLHGPFGEDGTIQGLLEMSGIPFVGSSLLASGICMDKDFTKSLLESHGVPHVPGICVERVRWQEDRHEVMSSIESVVTFPAFVKPSGSGSSLGVSKVRSFEALGTALDQAFLYDTKALIEPSQEGCLEVECSVLGNRHPKASVAGQILPAREFYDYSAKYLDEGTALRIPAPLDEALMERVRSIAVEAFLATGCSGMARVDFFVDPNVGKVLVNEINTIPGFTNMSMYPKLWEATGLSFPELLRELVRLAVEKQELSWKEVRLKTTD